MPVQHLLHTTCKTPLCKTQMTHNVTTTRAKRLWVPLTYACRVEPYPGQAQARLHMRRGRFVHADVQHNMCHEKIRLAGAEGIEPPAVGFGNRCSTAELHPCKHERE